MSSTTLVESKLDNLVSSYQDTEKILIEGSDEHLDLILNIQRSLKRMTTITLEVNNFLEAKFNSFTNEEAKICVVKLTGAINTSRQLMAFIRRSPSIFLGVSSCLKDLSIEIKDMNEFIQDLIKYKLNQPIELIELLKA
jgi:hypothetical protein